MCIRDSPKVAWVRYPGLPGDSQHELAQKYLPGGASGVVSFGVAGGRAAAETFMANLKLAQIATHVALSLIHISCLREVFGDAVYRIGDDEFCAVSTAIDYDRFAELTERAIRRFLEESIPASLGPAWHETCTDIVGLLDVAGDRMRSAKRGRHRAVDLGIDLTSDVVASSLLRPCLLYTSRCV